MGKTAAAKLEKGIDTFVEKTQIDAPQEETSDSSAGFEVEQVGELDIRASGISSIVWATGSGYDYNLVELPILDEYGYPKQRRGVTSHPGLYFLGLHWMHTITSGLFMGISADAAHVAEDIAKKS